METGKRFEKLVELMRILRSKKGCEWDREQTHESLKPYLIEEAYEVLAAIDKGNDEEFAEELGDLLLQIIFHSQIASERNAFTIDDVVETLSDKLIRRHPHVFGNAKGYSYQQWEKIKAEEKGKKEISAIGEINHALPALSLARRVQENAAAVGFDWENLEDVTEKVEEEWSELMNAIKSGDKKKINEEFGDLLFSMVNLSRFIEVDPEVSLRKATEKFMNRFRAVESLIRDRNLEIDKLSLKELDELWNEIKEGKQ
ncbi:MULTISPECIES: nucleoside triphosphate pyrophosphohydrolase [Kosmotoga]|uniref:MazG family protein n=1 Tax=Kosmotoga olearia (strain ATCC BAA-1733 / DSM 21960 / TBF 19.5.1) TaxID=521045 RepID=C5CGC7_KOSOT|nr:MULTISPECIES: nucleoside triphosphate pyrophosphohydrolase [Kosmotoga]ACR79568.1 MazG family protein [Kosmotoga olearia TBF 19.5.1]OAA22118.1 pyrophosphatase [Kosmotoga sp. DU53]